MNTRKVSFVPPLFQLLIVVPELARLGFYLSVDIVLFQGVECVVVTAQLYLLVDIFIPIDIDGNNKGLSALLCSRYYYSYRLSWLWAWAISTLLCSRYYYSYRHLEEAYLQFDSTM